MTTFTRTWDTAYEAIPADANLASEGASRIRNTRKDVQERGEVDHSWAGDVDDGAHKQVTFVDPLGADPSTVTDQGYLYTKNVSTKAELFWKDEDGNVLQLTAAGALKEVAEFAAATVMLFSQGAAPSGWTVTGVNDQAIRLRSVAANAEAGTSAFSTVFGLQAVDGHVLTEAQMPAHTHTTTAVPNNNAGGNSGAGGLDAASPSPIISTSKGSSASHAHNIELRVLYRECFLASKD